MVTLKKKEIDLLIGVLIDEIEALADNRHEYFGDTDTLKEYDKHLNSLRELNNKLITA